MKRFVLIIALVLCLLPASCKYNDSELWGAVKELQEQVAQNEKDIASLAELLEAQQNNKTIVSIKEVKDGVELTFNDGTKVTINNGKDGKDGKDGDTFFKSIEERGDSVIITLADGREITLLKKGPVDQSNAKRVSIMGDSYSTFEGWSNKDKAGNANGYYVYYPTTATDVTRVEQTWWWQLCNTEEFKLEVNNSFSSSTISNTWYGNGDVTGQDLGFTNRVGKNQRGVDYNGDPEIILIFGGTNDSWAGVKMGEYVYENWTIEELRNFRPAFAKLLADLKENYPNAEIYNISNEHTNGVPGLTDAVATSIGYICKHYGVPNIVLKNIAKSDNHPSVAGMNSIFEQVYAVLTGKADPAPEPEGEPGQTNPSVELKGKAIEYTTLNKCFIEYKTGELVSYNDPAWWSTEYVTIPDGVTKLSVAPITLFNGGSNGHQTCPVAFYDANKKYIKEGSFAPQGNGEWAGDIIDLPIPANAEFVRFCWADYNYTHVGTGEQVEIGNKINAVWPELSAE